MDNIIEFRQRGCAKAIYRKVNCGRRNGEQPFRFVIWVTYKCVCVNVRGRESPTVRLQLGHMFSIFCLVQLQGNEL